MSEVVVPHRNETPSGIVVEYEEAPRRLYRARGSGQRRPDVKTADLVAAYAVPGATLTDVAEQFAMSRGGVKKRLLSVGMTVRSDKARGGPENGRWQLRPSANAGRLRARKTFRTPEPCAECGTEWRPTRHHVDKDPTNNSPENIRWLCARCHSALHRRLEREAREAA